MQYATATTQYTTTRHYVALPPKPCHTTAHHEGERGVAGGNVLKMEEGPGVMLGLLLLVIGELVMLVMEVKP